MYLSLHPPSCAAILPSPPTPLRGAWERATRSFSENYMTLFSSDGVIEASGHVGEAAPEVTDARSCHRRRRQDGAGRIPEDPTATDEGRFGPVDGRRGTRHSRRAACLPRLHLVKTLTSEYQFSFLQLPYGVEESLSRGESGVMTMSSPSWISLAGQG